MKTARRITSFVVVLSILMTMIPASAFAEESDETYVSSVTAEVEAVPVEESTPTKEIQSADGTRLTSEPEAQADPESESDFTYTVDTNAGTATVTGYTGSETVLTIPDQLGGYPVVSIGANAFANNTALSGIVLPDTASIIGESAFSGCTNLSEVKLPANLTRMGINTFRNCTALTEIAIPKSLTTCDYSNNSFSGDHAVFFGCNSLKTVILEEGVTAIPANMFRTAPGIETVTIPESVTSIGNGAFASCAALKKIQIPDAVTIIGESAFSGCTNLSEVKLSASLTRMGINAFRNCTALTEITIPKSLTTCDYSTNSFSGDHAVFFGCKNLKTVILEEGMTAIPTNLLRTAPGIETITIPESVTSIGNGAFASCAALNSIVIPAAVTNIGESAFASCTALNSIVIPDAVTTIGGSAFNGCTNLSEVKLSANLKRLGADAFRNCTALTEITIPKSLTTCDYSNNSFSGDHAVFFGCTNLKTFILEEGMTAIPANMFRTAPGIETVTIPESVTSIGAGAFASCASLKKIELPDAVTTIGESAFSGCKKLSEVKLSANLTRMGINTFRNCTVLTEIAIPKSLTTCDYSHNSFSGDHAVFFGCNSLKTVILEEGVTAIPANLLRTAPAVETVTIPETVTSIGAYAFSGCAQLAKVHVPDTVIKIGSNAFSNSPNAVVYCGYDSYAAIYAIENSVAFRATGSFVDSDEYALAKEKSGYIADVKAAQANGYVSMTVTYAVKDIWKDRVSDKTVKIFLPANVYLDEFTLKLDGELCTYYTYDGARTLKIPVTADSGTIKFSVQMNEQKGLLSYAALEMKKDGTSALEVIGLSNEEINVLTLNTADVVTSPEVTVSGLGPASAEIVLSVDGVTQKTVTASRAGNWSAVVTIDSPKDYHSYTISASCSADDTAIEQTKKVTYHAGESTVTDFVMYYNEHNIIKECELMNQNGKKPKVYFLPGTQFDFSVTFDHPEQISKVYVTSTRNQEVKYLEAVYDEARNAFVTDGFFDESNPDYVPGVMSIEYTKKVTPVYVSDEVDWSIFDEHIAGRTEETVTTIESTETDYVSRIDLGSVYADLQDVIVDASISVYDEETDGDLGDWLGVFKELDTVASYVVPGYNDEKYLVSLDYSDPYTGVMLVRDITGSKFIKLTIDTALDNADNLDDAWDLIQVSSTLSTINTATGMLYKQHEIATEMDELRDEVMRTPYATDAQRKEALRQVDNLEHDQRYFALLTTVLPLVIACAAPPIGATMTMAPILFTAMLGVFTSIAPIFWEMRTAQIKSGQFRVDFVIDPSGYVYDTVTGERLQDVQATAYYIPYDESEDFWTITPPSTEFGTFWDASEYDQENPIRTNADGKYAWDVPEGWWRVQYEKDGYETVWSDWLPVPPPQTDVNIGMISNAHVHNWSDATCTEPKTCSVCGETEGDPLGHDFVDGKCSRCGEKDPDYKEPEVTGVTRVFDATRYDTAFKAADQLKVNLGIEKFQNIVVAYGEDFADALSGSYLANQKNAPILLVKNRNKEINLVKDYIKANLASGGTVYLLGGVNAVPKAMESGLEGFDVKRLAGATRYETNLEILKEAGISGNDILVCTGLDFADGLSASAVNKPILLVKDSLRATQVNYLKTLGTKNFYLIGGTNAVNKRVESALTAYGTTQRIEGATRYYTSVNIAKTFFPNAKTAVLAYAQNFPDGLSGGCLACSMNAPLILTANGKQAPAVAYAKEAGITGGAVLGGTGLIPDKVVRSIFAMNGEDLIIVK